MSDLQIEDTTQISMEPIDKFKRILEYFVKIMIYTCKNKEKGLSDFNEADIERITKEVSCDIRIDETDIEFKKSGKGADGSGIQHHMEAFANVRDNNTFTTEFGNQKICITIDATGGFIGGSYLHLVKVDGNDSHASTNINPVFEGEKFVGLEVGYSIKNPTYTFPKLRNYFEDLGLLLTDGEIPTETQKQNLQTFFNYFIEMREQELIGALTHKGRDLLFATHNMILTGAPGTGKTWSAKNIASWIVNKRSYQDLSDTEKMELKKRSELVQFHPSYDYTDFIEGLRPISNEDSFGSSHSNNIGFELKEGVFKRFCEKALIYFEVWKYNKHNNKSITADTIIKRIYDKEHTGKEESTPDWNKIIEKKNNEEKLERDDNYPYFIFIIDEINRGELSKIFGELFFSIDPGYRGENGAVLTQYANMVKKPNVFDEKLGSNDSNKEYGHFFIPENVYIIGTMNDIDRSVESMDFAMRRRFSFLEVRANERMDMWTEDWKDIAAACMKAVNAEIEKIPGLSSAYHIGPAYFKKLNDYKSDFFKLWDNHLYGVIFEYLRGKKDAKTTIDKIQDAYLKALVKAIRARFNSNGKWGEDIIEKWMLAQRIDSSISIAADDVETSKGNIKVYLLKLQKSISYPTGSENNRADEIFKLSNDIKKLMDIGAKIEKLSK